MRKRRQELKDEGYIIDDTCNPPFAYKGPRFLPKVSCTTLTPMEEEVEDMLINIIHLCDNPSYSKECIRQVANNAICKLRTGY